MNINNVKRHPASDCEGSQARISCAPIVAKNALDTLKISLWVDWGESLFIDRLEMAKNKAQATKNDESAPIDLIDGEPWNVMRTGTTMYPLRVLRGDVRVLFSRRKANGKIPNMRVEIGSMSCWSPGYSVVFAEIQRIIEIFGGVVFKEQVSEVHLCTDFVGQKITEIPNITNQGHWVSKTQKFQINYERRKLTGVTVGRGDFMLRIYDKVEELKGKDHKQAFFAKQWGIEYGSAPVTRVELQVRRNILREFQPLINTVEDLEKCFGGLWAYAVENWARFTKSPVDRENKHQSRPPFHPFWKCVKGVFWAGTKIIQRARQVVQVDVDALKKQASGIYMTISAALDRGVDDIETIIAFAQGFIEGELRRMFEDDVGDFKKRMKTKIARCRGISISELKE